MRTVRVLHVDDEPAFGDLVSELLKRHDERIEVVSETSALDALDRLDAEPRTIDCIVSDYDMPEIDGVEFLERVRAHDPELPFILFTGKGSEEVASKAISAGATDYLQKGAGREQFQILANRIQNTVEQHRAKQAERWLRELAETTNRVLFVATAEWDGVLFVNSAYEQIVGRPVSELRGSPHKFLDVVHPNDRNEVQRAMELVAEGEPIDIEFRVNETEDYERWVHARGEPITDDAGDIVRVAGFITDITGEKRRQRELERYERIVENLSVGVFRATLSGELVSANLELLAMYDAASKEELEAYGLVNIHADPGQREAVLDRLEEEGIIEDEPLKVRTVDGERIWVNATMRLVEEGEERYVDGIVQDITDRRDEQRRLEEAELFFEHSQDALFLVDVDDGEFRIRRVNPAYENATGLSNADVRGQTPTEILGPEYGKAVEERYAECVNRRAPLEYEEQLEIKGETTYWDTRVAPVILDGEISRLVGATRDITDRERHERELQENERRFEAMFNDPNILVGLLDADGSVVDINDTAMEYVDAALDDVRGTAFWETPWWSPEMRPMVEKQVQQAASGEYVEYTADLTDAAGDPYSVEGVIRPVTDDDGGVVSLLVSARDVTAQKERERVLAAILENTTTPMFMKDRQGEYLIANQGFRDLFDLGDTEIRGKTDEAIMPAAQVAEIRENDQQVLQTNEPLETEETIVLDGEERVFLSSKVPIHDIGTRSDPAEPLAVFGVSKEVTEQKEREQELRAQNERFDELASVISHDLQTPLEAVRGRIQLAAETGDADHLADALMALDRADTLREEVVEILRARQIVGEMEPVEVGEMAASVWETLQRPSTASLEIEDAPHVNAAPDALGRMLENLLQNAIDHGHDEITVRVGATDRGFYVADNGEGIPVDERADVFTPGYTTKAGGSGLGLASVRQIVEGHGWEIEVTDSDELGGTRVEITTE